MSTLAITSPAVSRLRLFAWRFPEWWVLAFSAAAWAVMITHPGHSHVQAGMAGVRQQLFAWMCMTTAMMLPAVVPQIRMAAQGSFWHRRHRAIAGFVAGYLLPWSAFGLAASLLLSLRWTRSAALPGGLFLLAAVWQRTSPFRSARRACHRTMPLAPRGWRADRDCVRYGLAVGAPCVRSCWPLMLACASTGHGTVAMTGGCLLGLLEAWSLQSRERILLAGTLALALYYLLVGMFATPGPHLVMHM